RHVSSSKCVQNRRRRSLSSERRHARLQAPMQEIVIHGGDYPHVAGIAGGYEGVRIAYRTRAVRQVFVDMLEQRSYECCEFSAANYLLLRASGQDWLTALPIFPYRAFRHS